MRTYATEEAFCAAACSNPTAAAATRSFQPNWLETYDPFDTPGRAAGRGRGGQPATAPVPGEASLLFLRITSWLSLLREGERMAPGKGARVLARTLTLLGSRKRDATRRAAGAAVRAAADTLLTHHF